MKTQTKYEENLFWQHKIYKIVTRFSIIEENTNEGEKIQNTLQKSRNFKVYTQKKVH